MPSARDILSKIGDVFPQVAFGESGQQNLDNALRAPDEVADFRSLFPGVDGSGNVQGTTFDKALHARNSMLAANRLAAALDPRKNTEETPPHPLAQELAAGIVDTGGQIREGAQGLMNQLGFKREGSESHSGGSGFGSRFFSPNNEIPEEMIRSGSDADSPEVRALLDQDEYDDQDMLANQAGTKAANRGNLSFISDPGAALDRAKGSVSQFIQDLLGRGRHDIDKPTSITGIRG